MVQDDSEVYGASKPVPFHLLIICWPGKSEVLSISIATVAPQAYTDASFLPRKKNFFKSGMKHENEKKKIKYGLF